MQMEDDIERDIISISNIKGKQEDLSIFEITNGLRVITEKEVNNAHTLTIEVNFNFKKKIFFVKLFFIF